MKNQISVLLCKVVKPILVKFTNFTRKYFLYQKLNETLLLQDQEKLYLKYGFDRSAGKARLNSICEEIYSYEFDESNGMFSEHLVLLSCISLTQPNIKNILEIGTHDGRCARILSILFPNALIKTIDLPMSDRDFIETYGRQSSSELFLETRKKNIADVKNVNFEEMNSLELCNSEERFDLIWIDGAHGYPVIVSDIVNSFRLVKELGYVLIDDVYKSVSQSDKWYKSIGAYETLISLQNIGLLSFTLFCKRLSSAFNQTWNCKYVALFKRNF